MKDDVKSLLKAIVIIFLMILPIFYYIFLTMLPTREPYYWDRSINTTIVGFSNNPITIDPVDTWDISSQNVERQVIEGLVQYNLSSYSNYEIIPYLAESWKWHGSNANKISFLLRQNVVFHDNTTFDADDVIWNLDRLTWFCNYTGTLPDNVTSWLASPASLYYFSDGTTPIISKYYTDGLYNITIELTNSFAPFLDLLTYVAGYIISPDSTPRWTYLDFARDQLVGTGPFKYIGFMHGVEVRFERFLDYDRWGYCGYWGDLPWTELLIFDINEDYPTRNMDMLALRIDYLEEPLPEMLDTFNESSYHIVSQFGESLCYYYLEFYCGSAGYPGLNVTWRKALQYAINYTYFIDEIFHGSMVRGPPVVPRLMPGHNASVQIIDTDITKARTLITSMFPAETAGLDANFPGTTESGWTTLHLKTVQLNRHYGSTINQKMNQNMDETFALIGVDTNETIRIWEDYLDTGENHPQDMEISYFGWCPDYLDAINILDPLFNNESQSNFAHINDPYLQSLLDQASKQLDALLRQQIYMHIQSYLFDINNPDHEWKYPHTPLFTSPYFIVHGSHLGGVTYNPLKILDCQNWYI